MNFYRYMSRYKGQDSPRGDLFYDISHDKEFPRGNASYGDIRTHLFVHNACGECMHVFTSSWATYQRELHKK